MFNYTDKNKQFKFYTDVNFQQTTLFINNCLNIANFNNKVVCDIGALDGRYSCAALELGARHVFAIESDLNYNKECQENLSHFFNSSKFTVKKDIKEFLSDYDYLSEVIGKVDLALCLGLGCKKNDVFDDATLVDFISLMKKATVPEVIVETEFKPNNNFDINYLNRTFGYAVQIIESTRKPLIYGNQRKLLYCTLTDKNDLDLLYKTATKFVTLR